MISGINNRVLKHKMNFALKSRRNVNSVSFLIENKAPRVGFVSKAKLISHPKNLYFIPKINNSSQESVISLNVFVIPAKLLSFCSYPQIHFIFLKISQFTRICFSPLAEIALRIVLCFCKSTHFGVLFLLRNQ